MSTPETSASARQPGTAFTSITNSSPSGPGWRALSEACGVDVAKAVVRFLAEEYR